MASIIEALHSGSFLLWAGAFGVLGIVSLLALILHIPFIARRRFTKGATKSSSGAFQAISPSKSLKNLDKKTYRTISNCFLKDRLGKLYKLDNIVVSKFGIFILVISDLQGILRGNDLEVIWYQILSGSSQEVPNPVVESDKRLLLLTSLIGKQNFISLIAFSDAQLVQAVSNKAHLVNLSDVPFLLSSYTEVILTPSQVSKIYSKLYRSLLRGSKYEKAYDRQTRH
jgi:hypothetical protein